MSPLIDAGILGPLRHSPGRSVLAAIAIALGVALGLAIHLINRVAADEISLAARSLYGVADLAVEGAAEGFDEQLYPRIAGLPGIAIASPVVQVEAKLVGTRGALTLIGVDAFRSKQLWPDFIAFAGPLSDDTSMILDPEALYLSARAASELNVSKGDSIAIQIGAERIELAVAGVLPRAALADRAGLMDISTVQWRFERLGKLSRINLRLAPGASSDKVRQELQAMLPGGVRVITPGEASNEALRLSRSYRSNLTALALVALFTGGFFVYSTQSLAALRRRREFAILHALGVTRRQQLWLQLAFSALMGAIGAAAGVVAGIAVAQFGVRALGADLGAGYVGPAEAGLDVRAIEVSAFWLLGIAVACAGALRPALDAANVPTANALKAGDVTSAEVRSHTWLVAGLGVLVVALLLAPPIAGLPLPGYVSIALLLIGTVAAMPAVMKALLVQAQRLPPVFASLRRAVPSPFPQALPTRESSAAPPPLRGGGPGRGHLQFHPVPYQIAIAHLAGTARYATLSVSAIIVSFSLMASMAIMVTSFRTSLDAWTQRLLPADVYLRVGYVGQSSHLDESTADRISRLPGIERAEYSRFGLVQLSPQRPAATLIARTADPTQMERSLWIVATSDVRAPAGTVPIWINEAASDLFELHAGDSAELTLADKQVTASVRGVWRDYEHQNGAVVIRRATYVELTGDRDVNTLWLWLEEGVSTDSIQTAIAGVLPAGTEYDLRTPPELRRLSLLAFDRTFAITYVLELVAILIGLFGIAAGTSAQVLARRGELGALRHLGLTRRQIAAMLAIEGAVLGALGVIVGLLTGAVVSLILIYVVNRQSFHWSMDLYAPVGLLSALSIALIGASALIAILSGRQAMSGDVVRAVREDW